MAQDSGRKMGHGRGQEMEPGFRWLNEPREWSGDAGRLFLRTDARTDFWRKTFYCFERDSGHAFLKPVRGDFTAAATVLGRYEALYDQAGLMLRLDAANWIKCGIEFTDGLNLVTANALYRFPQDGGRWTPYLGAGVGVNIPHVEVTRPSGKTFGYEFGGVTLQAQAGVDFRITERWSTFVEYKGTYSKVDVPIDSGDRLKTDIFTNAVNLGVSFHW